MYVVLAGHSLFQIDLMDLKFLGQVRGWKCGVGRHVYNFLLDGESVQLSDSVCRAGADHQVLDFQSTSVKFEEQPIDCPRENCFCGFDLGIPKGRTKSDLVELKDRFNRLSPERSSELPFYTGGTEVTAYGLDGFLREQMIHVEWYLGKRCNFDCSYCPPSIHDKVSPFPSRERLANAYSFLLRTILESNDLSGKVLDFIFHGGEPTLVPGFLDLLNKIRSDARFVSQVQTLTNFSRNVEYLYELNQASDLTYSVHLEYMSEDFLKKLANFLDSRDATSRNFAVKVMYLKEHRVWVSRIFEVLKQHPGIHFSVNPLHNKKDKLLYQYDEEDRAFFKLSGVT